MAGQQRTKKRKQRRGGVLLSEEKAKKTTTMPEATKTVAVTVEEPQKSGHDSQPDSPAPAKPEKSLPPKINTVHRLSKSFRGGPLGAHRASFSGTPAKLRRGSARVPAHLSPEAQKRRYSVVRIKSSNAFGENVDIDKLTPASEALTEQQINAFKEAFDLFDKNGGGTIDAQELQKTLESVGIQLEEEEIHDVMMRLDKDGNGEIDFEEFLNMMTNTEMFLEAFASRHGGQEMSDIRRERDILLFDALTEFMKKSALKDAHEIVGYYAKTYKKVVKSYNKNKGAHVVGHYADGARLIGLTEKQLVMQLKRLTLSQNYGDDGEKRSPYAQPLHLSMLRSVTMQEKKFKKRKKKTPRTADSGKSAESSKQASDGSYVLPKIIRSASSMPAEEIGGRMRRIFSEQVAQANRTPGKIVLKVIMNKDNQKQKSSTLHDDHKKTTAKEKDVEAHKDGEEIFLHKPGWLIQRNIIYNVDISLPIKYRKVQVDRLPLLRKTVQEAKTRFVDDIAEKKTNYNIRHYRELDSRKIPSLILNERFRKVFAAYSCAETNNRTAVTSNQLERLATPPYYPISKILSRKNMIRSV